MPLATLTYLPHVRQSSKTALPRPTQWKQPAKMNRLPFLDTQEMGGGSKSRAFPYCGLRHHDVRRRKKAAPMQYLDRLIKDI